MTDTKPGAKEELAKTFDPAAIEAKWYAHWEGTGAFRPARPDAAPYTIVNPPPNVTGSLHIGHALDNTLQDVMIRYERLRGKDALWVVGTDHAGIATQMVVERQLEAAQDKRTNYSREDFVKKVWQWKEESGGQITGQLRRLGCSMDWSREQFTMDPHFSKAVLKVFVDLYNQGLIYRDKRLVNWDPKLKTAISDLEVETREVQGSFWHFRYPLADGVTLDDGRDHIVVATTRPETMLADMAVAVNAEDPRYASVIGKFVELPITGRRIPIVADDHADPELGSGAVKITPGHDFNDFEVGRRAGIAAADMLNMFDAEAKVLQCGGVPDDWVGQDRFDVRKLVVEQMKSLGLLVPHVVTSKDGEVVEHDAEPRTIQTPYGDRGGVVIEPWLTDQWYVDAKTLAQPAIEAVKTGVIEIVPKSWEKTFFHWMDNIQPWCVSRQLWWGHRIPAWFGLDDTCFVAETQEEAGNLALAHYQTETSLQLQVDFIEPENYQVGNTVVGWIGRVEDAGSRQHGENVVLLRRDPDVLDTWFSSALWPFATLGWPQDAAEGSLLAKHYPNDLLISGFDILFFWDARMAMMGTHFMGAEGGRRPLKDSVPWKRLYLHGLVRAADGAKMSKSKGNTVDPLGLIDRYGADALRFFMAAMESQGRDIKMDERRVEGYRNFATKLWNAARFCQSNGIGASASVKAPEATLAVNRWIIGEVVETVAALDKALEDLRFDAAANAIYHFVWDQFCDWYLELIKPELQSAKAESDTGSPDAADARALRQAQGERGLAGSGAQGDPSPPSAQAEPVEAPAQRPHPAQGERADETRAVAGWVLDQILVMLHPFMPFITEELWHALGHRENDLILAQWPQPAAGVDAEAKAEVEWVISLVSAIRSARTELNVSPAVYVQMSILNAPDGTKQKIASSQALLQRLARVNGLALISDAAEIAASAQVVVDDVTYVLNLAGVIDIAAEKGRLTKAMEAAAKEARSLEGRLSNPAFVEKAKPEAVEKARADHAEKSAEAERLGAALERLG